MVNSFDSALADISGREQLMSMTGSGRTEVQSGEPVGEGAEDARPPMRDRSCARECAGPAAYRPEALAPPRRPVPDRLAGASRCSSVSYSLERWLSGLCPNHIQRSPADLISPISRHVPQQRGELMHPNELLARREIDLIKREIPKP